MTLAQRIDLESRELEAQLAKIQKPNAPGPVKPNFQALPATRVCSPPEIEQMEAMLTNKHSTIERSAHQSLNVRNLSTRLWTAIKHIGDASHESRVWHTGTLVQVGETFGLMMVQYGSNMLTNSLDYGVVLREDAAGKLVAETHLLKSNTCNTVMPLQQVEPEEMKKLNAKYGPAILAAMVARADAGGKFSLVDPAVEAGKQAGLSPAPAKGSGSARKRRSTRTGGLPNKLPKAAHSDDGTRGSGDTSADSNQGGRGDGAGKEKGKEVGRKGGTPKGAGKGIKGGKSKGGKPKTPNPEVDTSVGLVCSACGDGKNRILLCDGKIGQRDCTACYHLGCLFPPLKSIPRGDWYCPDCQARRREQVCCVV